MAYTTRKKYKRKAGSLTKDQAATKLQSSRRRKTTRKHTRRLQLYKNLPEELQYKIDEDTDSMNFGKDFLFKSLEKKDFKMA